MDLDITTMESSHELATPIIKNKNNRQKLPKFGEKDYEKVFNHN